MINRAAENAKAQIRLLIIADLVTIITADRRNSCGSIGPA